MASGTYVTCRICNEKQTRSEDGICSICRRKMTKRKRIPCVYCGRQTVDPDGVCSICRRAEAKARTPCTVCGKVKTDHPSGVCAVCRMAGISTQPILENTQVSKEYLELLIAEKTAEIRILTHFKDGCSVPEIADRLGQTRQQVAQKLRTLCGAGFFGVRRKAQSRQKSSLDELSDDKSEKDS